MYFSSMYPDIHGPALESGVWSDIIRGLGNVLLNAA